MCPRIWYLESLDCLALYITALFHYVSKYLSFVLIKTSPIYVVSEEIEIVTWRH